MGLLLLFVEISRCEKWFLHLEEEVIEINYQCKGKRFGYALCKQETQDTSRRTATGQHYSDHLLRSSCFILFNVNIKNSLFFLFFNNIFACKYREKGQKSAWFRKRF